MSTSILDRTNISDTTRAWLRQQEIYDDTLMSNIRDSDLSGLPIGQRVALRQAFPNLDPGVRAAAGDLSSIKAAIRERALIQLTALAEMRPDGVWSGD